MTNINRFQIKCLNNLLASDRAIYKKATIAIGLRIF